jgi:hypothetical protein
MLMRAVASVLLAGIVSACSGSQPQATQTPETPTAGTTARISEGASAAFCDLQAGVVAEGTPFSDLDPSDPASLQDHFEGLVATYSNLLAVAPSGVKISIEGGVQAMIVMNARLKAAGYRLKDLKADEIKAFQELAQLFDFEAFRLAAEAACS